MERGIIFFGELERMKKRMGQIWSELIEEAPENEERLGKDFGEFPNFEGIRRGLPRSQQNRTIK